MTDTLFYQDTTGVVGNLSKHHLYWVTAVANSKQSQPSGRVGEIDRSLTNLK